METKEIFPVKRAIGVVTFVQGPCVQGDMCPRRHLSKGHLSKETLVRGDISPRSQLSKETFVQGGFLSKETITCILVQGRSMAMFRRENNFLHFFWEGGSTPPSP